MPVRMKEHVNKFEKFSHWREELHKIPQFGNNIKLIVQLTKPSLDLLTQTRPVGDPIETSIERFAGCFIS
ncbi:hypothetical protein HAX54_048378, partial [Datura stramonium]|nr:hypothetical protein [Datura stramonium]